MYSEQEDLNLRPLAPRRFTCFCGVSLNRQPASALRSGRLSLDSQDESRDRGQTATKRGQLATHFTPITGGQRHNGGDQTTRNRPDAQWATHP